MQIFLMQNKTQINTYKNTMQQHKINEHNKTQQQWKATQNKTSNKSIFIYFLRWYVISVKLIFGLPHSYVYNHNHPHFCHL